MKKRRKRLNAHGSAARHVEGCRYAVWMCAAVLATVLNTTPIAAQFSVQPAVVQLHSSSSAPVAGVAVLRNEGNEDMQFRVYLSDFDQAENGDNVYLAANTHPKSCGSRLSVTPDGALLHAGEQQAVRIILQPGAICWTMVFVETRKPGPGMVAITQRIGVKVYYSPDGVKPAGEITGVTVLQDSTPMRVKVTFHNSGEAPLRPEGTLEIRTQTGEVVQTLPIEPFSALPGHHRTVTLALQRALPRGKYLAIPVLDFGAEYMAGDQTAFEVH